MKVIYTLLIALLSWPIMAQESFLIKGTVLDDQEAPLSFGEVLLWQASDSNLVSFTSIEAGGFELAPTIGGVYQLEVRALGFTNYRQTIQLDNLLQLGISLKRDVALLNEVTVVGKRNTVVNKNGNL